MKTLTLHQPYAHLVAIGAKIWETRSWSTSYRGPLAIHASKNIVECAGVLECGFSNKAKPRYPFNQYLKADWSWLFGDYCEDCLHYGDVIAVVDLVACHPAEQVRWAIQREISKLHPFDPTRHHLEHELAFGDFSDGRWAWKLRCRADMTSTPVPARGYQRLWNLKPETSFFIETLCAGVGIYLPDNTKLLQEAA